MKRSLDLSRGLNRADSRNRAERAADLRTGVEVQAVEVLGRVGHVRVDRGRADRAAVPDPAGHDPAVHALEARALAESAVLSVNSFRASALSPA